MGMHESSLLSQDIHDHLNRKETKLLVNAKRPQEISDHTGNWLCRGSLDLNGTLEEE